MSFFKMPTKVERVIKKIQREFLCGWVTEGRKIVSIKWDNIFKPNRREL